MIGFTDGSLFCAHFISHPLQLNAHLSDLFPKSNRSGIRPIDSFGPMAAVVVYPQSTGYYYYCVHNEEVRSLWGSLFISVINTAMCFCFQWSQQEGSGYPDISNMLQLCTLMCHKLISSSFKYLASSLVFVASSCKTKDLKHLAGKQLRWCCCATSGCANKKLFAYPNHLVFLYLSSKYLLMCRAKSLWMRSASLVFRCFYVNLLLAMQNQCIFSDDLCILVQSFILVI